jgi:cellulose biosynthesis protein BcsQ
MEIISFFSFKGGVGRTALVSNLGALWASQGKTVVLIDMDLSAPGLSFSPLAREWLEEAGSGLGVSDIMTTHYQQQAKGDQEEAVLMRPSMLLRRMKDPTAAPGEPEWGGDGRLLLIDAGSPHMIKPNECEEGQFGPIPTLDSPNLPENKTALRALAKGIRDDLAEWKRPDNGKSIDYVLIDCRTGFAELVDLSLGFLSDRMVLISGINGQNLKGLELTLRALRTERVQLDEFPAKVAVVLSPVPTTEDEALLEAMERAHGAISAAMRQTQSGLPESSPLLYHLHYTPALAFDERPLTLRQPKSRYAREVSLIASWIDRRLTSPWEMDAVTDDTLTSLYEKLGMGATRVSVGISPDSTPPSACPPDVEAEKRPNPASDLPPWYWALPPDQQSPEKRLRRLEKLVAVRSGVKIDTEAFANRLSWAIMSAKEKQDGLDRLPKLRQEAVDNAIADLDSFRSGAIQAMSGTKAETILETFYQAEKAWGVVANKKEATGLRRFLASPVDGECLFPSWEKWSDYWMMLARNLIVELSDLPRALKAIDRAVGIGDRNTIAGDLLKLIPADRMSSSMRSAMVSKARDLGEFSKTGGSRGV